MARIQLTSEKRLNLISGLQIRFDKFNKKLECNWNVTKNWSGALLAQAIPAPPPPGPAVLHNIVAEKGIKPDIAFEKNED